MVNWVIELIWNSMIVAILLSCIVLSSVYWYKKRKGSVFKHPLMTFLFSFYMIALLYVTIYREGLFMNTSHTLNMEPLKILLTSFRNLLYVDKGSAYLYLFYNVAGNMLWFVPLGFFVPYFMRTASFKKTILISFGISLSIEVIQYFAYVGVSDIDDLLFNTIGGSIGCGCYYLLYRRRDVNVH